MYSIHQIITGQSTNKNSKKHRLLHKNGIQDLIENHRTCKVLNFFGPKQCQSCSPMLYPIGWNCSGIWIRISERIFTHCLKQMDGDLPHSGICRSCHHSIERIRVAKLRVHSTQNGMRTLPLAAFFTSTHCCIVHHSILPDFRCIHLLHHLKRQDPLLAFLEGTHHAAIGNGSSWHLLLSHLLSGKGIPEVLSVTCILQKKIGYLQKSSHPTHHLCPPERALRLDSIQRRVHSNWSWNYSSLNPFAVSSSPYCRRSVRQAPFLLLLFSGGYQLVHWWVMVGFKKHVCIYIYIYMYIYTLFHWNASPFFCQGIQRVCPQREAVW